MSDAMAHQRLRRFLDPKYAITRFDNIRWQVSGTADTPGEDATCRIFIACAQGSDYGRVVTAGFAAFGPPVVIACADWACERIAGQTLDEAKSLSVRDFEQALAVAPSERYAILLVIDALANALVHLR